MRFASLTVAGLLAFWNGMASSGEISLPLKASINVISGTEVTVPLRGVQIRAMPLEELRPLVDTARNEERVRVQEIEKDLATKRKEFNEACRELAGGGDRPAAELDAAARESLEAETPLSRALRRRAPRRGTAAGEPKEGTPAERRATLLDEIKGLNERLESLTSGGDYRYLPVDRAATATTDGDGNATVKLDERGTWVLWAEHRHGYVRLQWVLEVGEDVRAKGKPGKIVLTNENRLEKTGLPEGL